MSAAWVVFAASPSLPSPLGLKLHALAINPQGCWWVTAPLVPWPLPLPCSDASPLPPLPT